MGDFIGRRSAMPRRRFLTIRRVPRERWGFVFYGLAELALSSPTVSAAGFIVKSDLYFYRRRFPESSRERDPRSTRTGAFAALVSPPRRFSCRKWHPTGAIREPITFHALGKPYYYR